MRHFIPIVCSSATIRAICNCACLLLAESVGVTQTARAESGRGFRHTNSAVQLAPLSDANCWVALKYDRIPTNHLQFATNRLDIAVTNSAMPLFYPLARPERVASIRVTGRVEGVLKVTPEQQGKAGYDDYALRVGLVEPSATPPGWWERMGAAAWVKQLLRLAPAGRGVAKVHFLNLGVDASEIGRAPPPNRSGRWIEEQVVAAPRPDGSFTLAYSFDPPMETCALWISVDGDDTGSSFRTVVREIALKIDSP